MKTGSAVTIARKLALALIREEQGQDLIEYSLLLAFVALATFGLLVGVKGNIANLLSGTNSSLSAATNAAAS